MRISTDILVDGKKIGEIWTNGRAVFGDPIADMQSIIDEEVFDVEGDEVVTAKSDPVAFVRNLCFKYRGRMLATQPKEG